MSQTNPGVSYVYGEPRQPSMVLENQTGTGITAHITCERNLTELTAC